MRQDNQVTAQVNTTLSVVGGGWFPVQSRRTSTAAVGQQWWLLHLGRAEVPYWLLLTTAPRSGCLSGT